MSNATGRLTDSIPGIYRITCNANQKFYIGSAVDIRVRWNRHRYDLRKGQHKNAYLQSSWNKYGEDTFIFDIVEHVTEIDKIVTTEQHWLDTTRCYDRTIGFNTRRVAESNRGIKRRRSLTLSDKQSKNWTVISPAGESSSIRNLEQFCKDSGLTVGAMRAVAYGKRDHHKGWRCTQGCEA